MRLLRLKLTNFRQHADTEIELADGLTGIIGPNGAGKSTLLEAIAWAIYGMDAARGKRDSLRWRRARPRAEVAVELEFRLGAHEYRVVRTLYAAELYLDGALPPIATSLQEVTARLTRVIGMSYEEFFNTYFTSQKQLAVMAAMPPKERGRFLARLLGYDKVTMAQERVRARRSELKAELAGLEHGFPDPARLAAERERIAEAREQAKRRVEAALEAQEAAHAASDQHLPVFTELVQMRDRYAALVGEKRLAEERVRQVVDEIARVGAELKAAREAAAELEALAPAIEAYEKERALLREADQLAKDAETRARLEAMLAENAKQRAEQEARLGDLMTRAARATEAAQGQDAARAELAEAERALNERRAQWEREKTDATAQRRALLEQYNDLKAQKDRVVAAGDSGACPTCGRALGSEYAAVLELLDSQLEQVLQNGQFYRARLEQLGAAPPELAALEKRRRDCQQVVESHAQELAVATAAATEALGARQQLERLAERAATLTRQAAQLLTGYDRARHEAIRQRVAELEHRVARSQRLAADAERVPKLAEALGAAEARRGFQVEELASLERELAALSFTEEAYQAASAEMQRLETAWRIAEQDVAVARAELGAADARLADAEQKEREAATRAARAATVQLELRVHNELDRAFDDLRTELNQELRPELSALAAEFLSSLTDGRFDELELDEDYKATILEDGAPQTVISGGEEDLMNLVIRFAVSQMIAERAGQPFSLLVLDEIFGSLDEARREQVVQLLRALEARFPQVILITHIESVRERLDRVIRVRFDEATGAAVVSEERVVPPLPDDEHRNGKAGKRGGDDANVAA
jgi:DNA repair protein SbcC/Rad50